VSVQRQADRIADGAAATARIDATLAALPADQREAMQTLRATIAAAAPGSIEAISYGAPAFRYRGHPLVSYAAARTHCSFFPMSPPLVEAHLAELAGFDTAKGTIRFTPDRPLPTALIGTIVRERMAELDAKRTR
jgi:uncharacterized protein YdhG (YjbR/CyaY superfamily)